MTALLASVGCRTPVDRELVKRALETPGARGGRRSSVLQYGSDTLGVARHDSDARPEIGAAEPMLAADHRFTVLADATLYYVADLERRLSLFAVPRATPRTTAQLILDAYRAFGARSVDCIEGDFAFVVWDRAARRLFCARDLSGRRPLYYAPCGAGLAAASTLGALASLPGVGAEPDLGTVGANAAGLFFALGDETSMRGARSLSAGCTMEWRSGSAPTVRRYWTPTTANVSDLPFEDAAEALRGLLRTATTERLTAHAPTAVWMSGGRDSSAVFASANAAITDGDANGTVFPVSRSHPVGDVEREDESIDAIARFWNVSPAWVNARDVPLFGDDDQTSRWTADSFEQPFVRLTKALARASADAGAIAALDGHGGDFLFQVSRGYLADLVSRGRITRAWREWNSMDVNREGVRGFVRAGIQPHVNGWMRALGSPALSARFRGSMERVAPPWISPAFLAQHHLFDRSRAQGPDAQPGHDAADRETRFCLTHPFFANVNSAMAGYALEHGVELRSPLLDRRVVDFALTRPRDERNQAGDQKRLLRAAMRGLLPEATLAPRLGKTGTLRTYFVFHMCNDGLARLRQIQHRSLLADGGIVDPRVLSAAIEEFARRGPAYPHIEALFCTLRAEQWLRTGTGLEAPAAITARRSA